MMWVHLSGGPPGRAGGGKNAGWRGSRLNYFFSSVENLDVAFFVHEVRRPCDGRGSWRVGTLGRWALVAGGVGRVAAVIH